MSWIDCRDRLPENEQKIFVLDIHGKRQWPESYQLIGMEAVIDTCGRNLPPRCCEGDGHGGGSWTLYFDTGLEDYAYRPC